MSGRRDLEFRRAATAWPGMACRAATSTGGHQRDLPYKPVHLLGTGFKTLPSGCAQVMAATLSDALRVAYGVNKDVYDVVVAATGVPGNANDSRVMRVRVPSSPST